MNEENFREMFLLEAGEILQEMEESLLKLEKHPDDSSLTNDIFRHMHSLKGSGSMFGFQQVSNFTHHLESLFDMVRNNPTVMNARLFDITFRSIDHIRKLLSDATGEPMAGQSSKLTEEVEELMQSIRGSSDKSEGALPDAAALSTVTPDRALPVTWYILFKPDEDILINGTNPLYLLDELLDLGSGIAFAHTENLPDGNGFNPKLCYLFWEVILVTSEQEQRLRDVFLFVEDSAVLEIEEISSSNLLDDPLFVDLLSNWQPDSGVMVKEAVQPVINSREEEPMIPGEENARVLPTIRVASEKLDTLMNLVSEFVTAQARLDLYTMESGDPQLIGISEQFKKLSRQLRENTFDICLIPLHHLVTRFSRLVRDLSASTGKLVRLTATGTDTELDKTIVEQLSEPLLHIIRNCIDHGIEPAVERRQHGKPETGQITFDSYNSGTYVYIVIQDDGKGIDLNAIRRTAVERGLIGKDEEPERSALLDLLFLPGFTTSSAVTTMSGRGVGMDVVKQKIEEIRGTVWIESEPDQGTTIRIRIPLTLSIIDGFLLKVGETAYILPLASVEKIHELTPGLTNEAFRNVITLEGEQYPFFDLRKEFGVKGDPPANACIINVSHEERIVGLAVDQIVGNYQAVLKPIGKYLKEQHIFSGAAILGDGSVALVLDPHQLIMRYANE